MTLRLSHRRKAPFVFANRATYPDPPVYSFPPCQRLMLYDDSVGEIRLVTVSNHDVVASVASPFVRASRHVGGGAAVLAGLGEDVVVTVYNASLGVDWSWTDEITQPHEHGDIGVDEDGAVYFAIATTDTVTVYKVADGALEWSEALEVEGVDTTVGPPVSITEGIVMVAGGDRVFALSGTTGTEIDSATWEGATACAGSCFGNAFVVFARIDGDTFAQRFSYFVPGGFGAGEITAEGAVLVHDGVEEPWFTNLQGSALMYGGAGDDGYFVARVDPVTLFVLWRNAASTVGAEAITSLTQTANTGIGFERRMFAGRNVTEGEAALLRGFARVAGISLSDSGPVRDPPVSHAIRAFNCPTGSVSVLAAAVTFENFNAGQVTRNIVVPGGAAPGNLVIITMWSDTAGTIDSAPAGTITLGADPLEPIAISGTGVTRLWAFAVPGASAATVASFETTGFYGVVTATVLGGGDLSAVDVAATIRVDQAGETPQEITGTATASGVQLLIGGLTRFTGGT